MNSKFVSCVALVCVAAWLQGCAAVQRPATEMPEVYHDFRIHMVDAKNGWMKANRFEKTRVLHTGDGGKSWADVTPLSLTNRIWDCQFPKSQMAWISYYDGKTHLLFTTNAGKSWAPWVPLGDFNNDEHNFFLGGEDNKCRFFSTNDGLAEMIDAGTCQAVYNFFETHDGGMTWRPAPIVPESGSSRYEIPGTFHLGDCDGSAISYYPPAKTVVIVNGDMVDETPKGVVRLNLTTNAGESWRNMYLPLPEKYQQGLVSSLPPHFFDKENALLPLYVTKRNENNSSFVYRALIFFATADGGNSWALKPAVLDSLGTSFDSCTFLSEQEVIVQRDIDLYVTRDGLQCWRPLKPGLGDIGRVLQMDFVDARRGWLVAKSGTNSSLGGEELLYRTENGGVTWKKLEWKFCVNRQ
jgi:photosystem II stability/assembly factor-like uncharacterized protein